MKPAAYCQQIIVGLTGRVAACFEYSEARLKTQCLRMMLIIIILFFLSHYAAGATVAGPPTSAGQAFRRSRHAPAPAANSDQRMCNIGFIADACAGSITGRTSLSMCRATGAADKRFQQCSCGTLALVCVHGL